jgi:hypothetical protein
MELLEAMKNLKTMIDADLKQLDGREPATEMVASCAQAYMEQTAKLMLALTHLKIVVDK